MSASGSGEEAGRRWLAFMEAVVAEKTDGEEKLLRGKLRVEKLIDDGCG